jgi:hypothetical protein
VAQRRERRRDGLGDVDGGGERRRIHRRRGRGVRDALDEVEVNGLGGGEVLGGGLDDGEALWRLRDRGSVEAEERGECEQRADGGLGVQDGVDFIVEAAAGDARGVAPGDGRG